MYDDYYKLGFTARTFGVKGELIIILNVDDETRYASIPELWLATNGTLTHYRVLSSRVRKNELCVSLEGLTVIEEAEKLLKQDVYLPLSYLPSLGDKNFYFHEVKGFSVMDMQHGAIGTLIDILEFPGHAVMQVNDNGLEILIPVRSEFIEKVDRQNRQLYVNTPEGLIDVYQGKDKEES